MNINSVFKCFLLSGVSLLLLINCSDPDIQKEDDSKVSIPFEKVLSHAGLPQITPGSSKSHVEKLLKKQNISFTLLSNDIMKVQIPGAPASNKQYLFLKFKDNTFQYFTSEP